MQVSCFEYTLRACGLFKPVTTNELGAINEIKRDHLVLPAGSQIIRAGDDSPELYTLYSGWAFRFKMLLLAARGAPARRCHCRLRLLRPQPIRSPASTDDRSRPPTCGTDLMKHVRSGMRRRGDRIDAILPRRTMSPFGPSRPRRPAAVESVIGGLAATPLYATTPGKEEMACWCHA
jgi:hypothetical protein